MVLSFAGQVFCQNSGVFDLDWFYMGSNLDSLGKSKMYLQNSFLLYIYFEAHDIYFEAPKHYYYFSGKPKFKVSQHPDGYSAEGTLMGQSINLNYTNHEQTASFNIFDYSGNVKIQIASGKTYYQ